MGRKPRLGRRTRVGIPLACALAIVLLVPSQSGAGVRIDPSLSVGSDPTTALVTAAQGASLAEVRAAARSAGLDPQLQFAVIDVQVVRGTPAELVRLARSGVVQRIDANSRLEYYTDTSHVATRGQDVLDGAVTLPGLLIDGAGVGVAVIDSGVDGTHPDLQSNMSSNVKLLGSLAVVPLPDTDTPSLGGHGTHVAGIVAGTGAASNGLYHGAAPRARLHGVSAGTAILVTEALQGLRWVLNNRNSFATPIRVVNNSWGTGPGPYDPGNPVNQMVNQLVGAGVTVVFANGNDGPGGDTTQSYCRNPTAGVICVAAYNDANTGTRDGQLADFSSRGAPGSPSSYPDLSAPGVDIISTCRLTLPICLLEGIVASPPNSYAHLSGTSMAAPHIAGIAAQMLQASPSLSPAGVENLLEDTAHKFSAGAAYESDPANPDDTTSVDKGHGLVDVLAAAQAAVGP